VKFPRTLGWWTDDWREISSWLSTIIGVSGTDWEYIGEEFMFNTEEHKILFLLRWR
jgi:hypothetical protein